MNVILVIDIGNTTIAFTGIRERETGDMSACRQSGQGGTGTGTGPVSRACSAAGYIPEDGILFEKKLPTQAGKDIPGFLDQAGKLLAEEESAARPSRIRLVSISSVVPACTPAAVRLAQTICSAPPVVVSRTCDTGLSLARLPFPDKVGADRIADAAWAAAAYPLPAMTADLGTATTINIIARPDHGTPERSRKRKDRRPEAGGTGSAREQAAGRKDHDAGPMAPPACGNINGIFLGGMIGAGVRTSLQALRSGTAQLPALEPQAVPPDALIGRDTDGCMLSAAVVGTAAMIDGLAAHVEQQLGRPLTLILTGGNARYVREWIRHPFVDEPHLAAKGIALIGLREAEKGKILTPENPSCTNPGRVEQ